MVEQDTIRLLRECDAGVKMGVSSIDENLKSCPAIIRIITMHPMIIPNALSLQVGCVRKLKKLYGCKKSVTTLLR